MRATKIFKNFIRPQSIIFTQDSLKPNPSKLFNQTIIALGYHQSLCHSYTEAFTTPMQEFSARRFSNEKVAEACQVFEHLFKLNSREISNTLRFIQSSGIKTAGISSSSLEGFTSELEEHELLRLLNIICASQDGTEPLLQKACKQLHSPLPYSWLITTNMNDLIVAKNMNAGAIYLTPLASHPSIKEADFLIRTSSEIQNIIASFPQIEF